MQAIDHQPSILLQTNTLLMSIKMSIMTMSNTNTEAVPNSSNTVAQAASLSANTPDQSKTMTSSLPLEDAEQVKANNTSVIQHRKNQIKRLFTETWLRLVLILGTLFAIAFVFVLMKTFSTESVAQDATETSSSMIVSGIPDGSDNLNPAQAEYLREMNRREAAEQAHSGVTNAPSLVLPTASVTGVDSNAVSDASAFTVGSTKSYYAKEETDPDSVKTMSLAGGQRFSTVGASKLDEQANQLAIERARVAAASVQAPAGTDPALAKSNATYNTNQNGGVNNSGNNGANNGGNNGANNGGNNGGDTGAGAVQSQPQERQPDADLPIVQQRLYDSYNEQIQELQAQEERLAAQQAANQQQAAQLRQQRQQQATQAIASQMQSQAQKRTGSGFTSKKYMPEKNTTNSDNSNNQNSNSQNSNNQNTGYWPAQPNASGYQPIAYSYDSSYGNQGQFVSENDAAKPPPLLAKNIIRAGTKWPVVITKHVNTDEGLSVSGVIVGGPFDGATVHGTVQPSGRNVGVLFNRIEPKNPRKQIVPLNALAQTIGSQKEAVASQVKNHYVQNYSVMALESAIGGYGEAYSDQNETVVTGPTGVIIQSKGETTQKEVTAEILKQFSDRLNEDIGRLGNRAPTFIINQGTVLHMVLLSNLDIYGTVNGPSTSGQQQQQSTNNQRTSL